MTLESFAGLRHLRIGRENGLRVEAGNDSRPELPLFGLFGFRRSVAVKAGCWYAALAWGLT